MPVLIPIFLANRYLALQMDRLHPCCREKNPRRVLSPIASCPFDILGASRAGRIWLAEMTSARTATPRPNRARRGRCNRCQRRVEQVVHSTSQLGSLGPLSSGASFSCKIDRLLTPFGSELAVSS
jgi:hypothetical protein